MTSQVSQTLPSISLPVERKSDEVPTTWNGIFSLASQVVVSGTRFLITIIIAKSCGETTLGIYALVLSLVFISIMVQQTLITTPYANFRHRLDAEDEPQYFRSTWMMSAAFGLLAAAVILSLGGLFGLGASLFEGEQWKHGAQELSRGCVYAALATPFITQMEFFRRVLLIRMQARWALVLDTMISSVVIGCLVALMMWDQVSATNTFLLLATVNSVFALFAFWCMVRVVKLDREQLKKNVAKHWKFGKWIFSAEAITFGRGNLLKWIIGGFLGLGATGIYSACDSLMRAINPYFLGVASVAEPTLARGFAKSGKGEVKRLAFKVMLIMAAGTLPICLTVALSSQWLLLHLFDEKFAEYSLVVVWLSSASFMSSLGYPLANSLQAIDRPDINFRIRVVTMVIVVAGSIVAAATVGLWGIALMQFVGSVTSFLLRAWFFNALISSDVNQENRVVEQAG